MYAESVPRQRADRDYYATLGLSPEATEDEIRRTYRRLALQWHPDRNPGDPRAEERFKEISEAYAVLIDAARREAYDSARRAGRPGGVGAAREDVFRDLFNDPRASAIFEELARELTKAGLRVERRDFERTLFGGRMVMTGGVFVISPLTFWRVGRAVLRSAFQQTSLPPAARTRLAADLTRNRILPPGGAELLTVLVDARSPSLPAVGDLLFGRLRVNIDAPAATLLESVSRTGPAPQAAVVRLLAAAGPPSTAAAGLLAGCRLAAGPLAGRARQHAIFGGDPALTEALHPGWHLFLDGCGAKHLGMAEFDEARPFRMARHATFQRHDPHFVHPAPRRSHDSVLSLSFGPLLPAGSRGCNPR